MEETSELKRNERYGKYVSAVSPKSEILKSLIHSWLVGGLTCMIAQGFHDLYTYTLPNQTPDMISNFTLITIISIAIILTGFGVFDRFARVGGAGLFLPITGFANSMASAGMEFKSEGLILGTSAKLFSVVGPVMVNGVLFSAIAGILHLLIFGMV